MAAGVAGECLLTHRILVYEALSAAPPPGAADPTGELRAEGRAMLIAAAAALAEVPDVEVSVCTAAKLGPWRRLAPARFPAAAGDYADVLLIAPELGGRAAQLAAAIVAAGGALLGPGPEVVALATDKRRCGQTLGDLAPPCWPADAAIPCAGEIVVKPRAGAGSLFTVAGPAADAARLVAAVRQAGCADELVIQPRIVGRSVSVALLGRPPRPPLALPAARQDIAAESFDDNPKWTAFHYCGGGMPLPEPWQSRATALALRAAECLPPWRGYLGIDMILGSDQDFVLDVNPRLTTSFLGYARLLPGRLGRFLLGRETADDLLALTAAKHAEPISFAA